MDKSLLRKKVGEAEQQKMEAKARRQAAEKRISDHEGTEVLARVILQSVEETDPYDRWHTRRHEISRMPFRLQERKSQLITLPSDPGKLIAARLLVKEIIRARDSETLRSRGLTGYGQVFNEYYSTLRFADIKVDFMTRNSGESERDWQHLATSQCSQDPLLYDSDDPERRAKSMTGDIDDMLGSLALLEEAIQLNSGA